MKALLALIAVSVAVLLLEALALSQWAYPVAIAGVALALALATSGIGLLTPAEDGGWVEFFTGMLDFDAFSDWMTLLILIVAVAWLLSSQSYLNRGNQRGERVALSLFATTGALMLCSASNLTMLFVGVETLSVPLYVLAGSAKGDLRSSEASLKYFVLGAFASTFMLMGIALIFGATGSLSLNTVRWGAMALVPGAALLFKAGTLMLLASLLFKVAVVPFHFWAPDVYEGAPTAVTGFMATVVKMGGFAALVRLFASIGGNEAVFGHTAPSWMPLAAGCVGASLLLGNLTAAVQDSVKRLLAFSSVAHAGFLLLAVIATQVEVVGYYAFSYALASLLSFGVVSAVGGERGGLKAFNGLFKRSPVLAITMTVALCSLAGIPPTGGFVGKYLALVAAFDKGFNVLALLAVVGSIVGVYYYFRIIVAMFLKEPEANAQVRELDMGEIPMFITLAIALLVIGVRPDWVSKLVDIAPPVVAAVAQ